ncbi:hypothetical protein [Blastopirellula marina]|uniref:Uncharacterized protein n=1 Tax=Blastopirellula marina DSM 3645 TaxID=314230 RepID=A3ZRI4_9BACT|nr:hypothetical protein [Blastopirellula marina]EAQ80753.1 hypothetical protein DSM3645_12071 [Blastopirellula marina DSM 3645]
MNESAAHRHFAVQCFNGTWDLINQSERTESESAQMLIRSAASLWHWSERDDCTPQNMSIGYWQMSRVLVLLGEANLAARFGQMCLQVSPAEDPFLVGFAYEALARAALVAGDKIEMDRCLTEATMRAGQVTDADIRKALEADLATIAPMP